MRWRTANKRAKLKRETLRQYNQRLAAHRVRRFRKMYPKLRDWWRRAARSVAQYAATTQTFTKTLQEAALAMGRVDVHAALAQELFGVQTPATQRRAKTINYQSLYGGIPDLRGARK